MMMTKAISIPMKLKMPAAPGAAMDLSSSSSYPWMFLPPSPTIAVLTSSQLASSLKSMKYLFSE